MSIKTSPALAPQYALYREAVATVDTISNFTKKHGCNGHMYNKCHVQVIPDSGANPSVEVYFWSDAADSFIKSNTPIAKTGIGADVPYEFTIEPMGRIFFVSVAAIAAGTVNIYISGYEHIQ